jgi:hypothetical protein
MKHLKNFENFNYINESVSNNLLLESKDIKTYKIVQDKTISKLSLNLYFANNFGWGVPMLYPIVEALIKNSNIAVTKEQVVLLTLFSITQILNIANNDIRKIRSELEKDNLMNVVDKVKKSLLSVYKIFSFISRSFGKVIDSFTDMVAYVSLGVPFTLSILEIISKEGLDIETLPQKIMVFGGGAAVLAIKSLAETLIDMIKSKAN